MGTVALTAVRPLEITKGLPVHRLAVPRLSMHSLSVHRPLARGPRALLQWRHTQVLLRARERADSYWHAVAC